MSCIQLFGSIQHVNDAEMQSGPVRASSPSVAGIAERRSGNIEIHSRHEFSEGICGSVPDVFVPNLAGQQPVHSSPGRADIACGCGIPWLALQMHLSQAQVSLL